MLCVLLWHIGLPASMQAGLRRNDGGKTLKAR